MTVLFWLVFVGAGAWCLWEYRDHLRNKMDTDEIERWANDRHDD